MAGANSNNVLMHASCISIAGRGALLIGPSGAGKSDLALRLIHGVAQSAAQTGGRTGQVDLVADDQVIIEQREGQLVARAPPNLAGLLEVRGLGILEMPYAAETELCLVVDLARSRAIERLPDPMLSLDILGHRLPLICLGAFEASAPLKVVLALMRRPIDP